MRGRIQSLQYDLEGKPVLTLCLEYVDRAEIEKLMQVEIDAEVKKYSPKKSDQARKYFWKLCDMIASVLRADRHSIYLQLLRDYGVEEAFEVSKESEYLLSDEYRDFEIDYDYEVLYYLEDGTKQIGQIIGGRGYKGLSKYTQAEISRLIDGTVYEAKELDIETLPPEELERMVSYWKSK